MIRSWGALMCLEKLCRQVGRVRTLYSFWGLALLLGLLTMVYAGRSMLSYQQERDLQWMREQACKQDLHCLHP